MMRKWSHTILFPLKVLFCLPFLLFTYNMFIFKTRCNDQKQSSAGCTFPIPLSRDIFSQLIFNTQQCFWCWCCLFVNCFPADFKVTWLVYFWCWCCDSSWSQVLSALRQLKAWISKKHQIAKYCWDCATDKFEIDVWDLTQDNNDAEPSALLPDGWYHWQNPNQTHITHPFIAARAQWCKGHLLCGEDAQFAKRWISVGLVCQYGLNPNVARRFGQPPMSGGFVFLVQSLANMSLQLSAIILCQFFLCHTSPPSPFTSLLSSTSSHISYFYWETKTLRWIPQRAQSGDYIDLGEACYFTLFAR